MKPPAGDRTLRAQKALARFTGAFPRSVAVPSDTRPTARCLSRRDALAAIIAARDSISDSQLQGLMAAALLDLLEKSGVMEPVPIEPPAGGSAAIYALGIQSLTTLEPLELLQAAEPSGLICYFTALSFYGLTTQSPSHHHVARLVERTAAPTPARNRLLQGTPSARARNALGTLLFTYHSVPYYETSRVSLRISRR